MNQRSIKIPEDVLRVLSVANYNGSHLSLVGQIDRKLYVETNKVLEAAGGKWNRKAKAHVFDCPAAEAIEPIILTGEYSRTKQDFGQFDTPAALAARIVEMAEVEPGMDALEPSAGVGNIAVALCNAGAHVMAYEIDPKRCSNLVTTLRQAPGMNMVVERDFLAFKPSPTYDRVVMNPPFARQEDIRHVIHALGYLKPSGRLVSVMSAGVLFRADKRTTEFRELIDAKGGSIERLPDGSFSESGTKVSTCVVSVQV